MEENSLALDFIMVNFIKFYEPWFNEFYFELKKCKQATFYVNPNRDGYSLKRNVVKIIPISKNESYNLFNKFKSDKFIFFEQTKEEDNWFFNNNNTFNWICNSDIIQQLFDKNASVHSKFIGLLDYLDQLFNTPFICKEKKIVNLLKKFLENREMILLKVKNIKKQQYNYKSIDEI